MSFFYRKSREICATEIETVTQYAKDTFHVELNLEKLKDQIDSLIEDKVAFYNHQRFKDWVVADLLLLSDVLKEKLSQNTTTEITEQKGKKRNKV